MFLFEKVKKKKKKKSTDFIQISNLRSDSEEWESPTFFGKKKWENQLNILIKMSHHGECSKCAIMEEINNTIVK